MTLLPFDLTCVVLPKSSPGPEKMHAKNLRHFWHFSTFDLEYLFTNAKSVKTYRTKVMHIYKFYRKLSRFRYQPLFLGFYKGLKSLLNTFLTIDFLLSIKEQEMFILTISIKDYQNICCLLRN